MLVNALFRHIVLLMAAIAAATGTHAQEVHTFAIHAADIEFVDTDSSRLIRLQSEACNGHTTTIGGPMLPTYQQTFIIEGDLTLSVLNQKTETMQMPQGSSIWPVQPTTTKSQHKGFDPGYLKDNTLASPPEPITLRRIGKMRDKDVWQLTIVPIAYDHQQGVLTLSSITYRIDHATSPIKSGRRQARYQVVAPSEWEPTLAPLMRWRKQCGMEVGITYSNELRPDSIRSLLKAIMPDYVLVVGDHNIVGSFSGRHNIAGLQGHYADLYFGEYTNDYLADAMVGRLTVSDTTELRQVIEKILRYERGLGIPELKQAMFVAGKEGTAPAPTTTNGQVNYVSERFLSTHADADTICYRNPESFSLRDSILLSISRNPQLINYTAHCTSSGWNSPNLNASEAGNTSPTVWVNNCCLSNMFSSTCFGEQLLRKQAGGAVGVIGATNETLWEEDYYWSVGAKRNASLQPAYDTLHKGAFDKLFDHDAQTLGEMLMAGNMAVTEAGSPYDAFYWEIYCLIGDPATKPNLGEMDHLSLTAESTTLGSTSISVSCDTDALITIMQNGDIIGSRLGSGTISLAQPASAERLIITATKNGSYPAVDTLTPQRSLEARLAPTVLNPNEVLMPNDTATMRLVVQNVGLQTAYGHRIMIAKDSLLIADTVFMEMDTMAADTIGISICANQRRAEMVLDIMAADSSTYSTQTITWHVLQPSYAFEIDLLNEGTITQKIDPNSLYEQLITINCANTLASDSIHLVVNTTTYPDLQVLHLDTMASATSTIVQSIPIHTERQIQGILTNVYTEDTTITRWWNAGLAKEDFEEEIHYPWTNNSPNPWTLDSTSSHNGHWSMRSGTIGCNERCDLSLTVNIPVDDTISFWSRISTETNNDQLIFYIDGKRQYYWSGNRCWGFWQTDIAHGRHTLLWRYQKNASVDDGNDAVWIDDIRLPMCYWDTICGNMAIVEDTTDAIQEPTFINWQTYPNPASQHVVIESRQEGRLRLIDINGRKLVDCHLNGDSHITIPTESFPNGIYILTLTTSNTTVGKKLIINH